MRVLLDRDMGCRSSASWLAAATSKMEPWMPLGRCRPRSEFGPVQEPGTAGATGRGARMAIIAPLTQATQIRKGNRPSTPAKPLAL